MDNNTQIMIIPIGVVAILDEYVFVGILYIFTYKLYDGHVTAHMLNNENLFRCKNVFVICMQAGVRPGFFPRERETNKENGKLLSYLEIASGRAMNKKNGSWRRSWFTAGEVGKTKITRWCWMRYKVFPKRPAAHKK